MHKSGSPGGKTAGPDSAPGHIRKMYDACSGEFSESTIRNIDKILAKCETIAAHPAVAAELYKLFNFRGKKSGIDRRGGYIVALAAERAKGRLEDKIPMMRSLGLLNDGTLSRLA